MKKKSKLDRITLFDVVVTFLVLLVTFIMLYPLYFCVIASFSSPNEVALGHTLLWVKDFTLDAYKFVLEEKQLWIGYRNTIFYTLLGTTYNLVLTIPAAYVMTKKEMPFHSVLSWFFFITMYLSGGTIPTYILYKDLNLIDSPLALVLGVGVSCYNLIVTRQYFSSTIPKDLYESAYLDGASEWKCFSKIAAPLAKPIIAVMALYYGVDHWNGYYNALLYIRNKDYYPLQLVLRGILINNDLSLDNMTGMTAEAMEYAMYRAQLVQGMKYAIVLIASLPLLILYPFLQKYFAKGIMVGSVKG